MKASHPCLVGRIDPASDRLAVWQIDLVADLVADLVGDRRLVSRPIVSVVAVVNFAFRPVGFQRQHLDSHPLLFSTVYGKRFKGVPHYQNWDRLFEETLPYWGNRIGVEKNPV